ncbi:MAG: alanyl-tRNA editing protein [Clostridia bacterium]
MTKRLYQESPELTECMATVLDCKAAEGGFEVLLSDTIIFPESGGQLSDTGSIDKSAVKHARESGDEVWHLTDSCFDIGAQVKVALNIADRTDHSQQHTGEHIISGLANKLFDTRNVGFHMAADHATLDLDKPLTAEQIAQLERAANAAVQHNIPITYRVVDETELDTLTLRKRAQGLHGDIRIVFIDGVDSCTCCGTHCAYTGGVGYIKLVSAASYKGGTRIWFACGMRAVDAAKNDQSIIDLIAKRFSIKAEDTVCAVQRQGDELNAARRELKRRTDELLEYRAAELKAGSAQLGKLRLVVYQGEELGVAELKLLSEKLCGHPGMVAVLFSHCGESVLYQLARAGDVAYSMRELCQAVNAALGGKGGGKDDMAQGSAKYTGGYSESLEQLRRYFAAALSA